MVLIMLHCVFIPRKGNKVPVIYLLDTCFIFKIHMVLIMLYFVFIPQNGNKIGYLLYIYDDEWWFQRN